MNGTKPDAAAVIARTSRESLQLAEAAGLTMLAQLLRLVILEAETPVTGDDT